MRVGIAGYGVVGKTRHASIKKNTSYEVVAISEANSEAQKNIPSDIDIYYDCLLYTSPSPRDVEESRMPSSA